MIFSHEYKDGLFSERLQTRFLSSDDIAVWTEFFLDKDAMTVFAPFEQETPEDIAEYWIKNQQRRYREQLFGLQALIERSSGKLVGQCGLLVQEIDGNTEVEVGYHIIRKYWGNGYAPEAARLFINYAFDDHVTDSVVSIINTDNFRSQRVAEKNGLVPEKQTNWRGKGVFVYRIMKENWTKV